MTADNENLTALLQQLQQGDERAFSKIYDHFSRPIYRNALRLVNDEEIAEEILQEVFLTVWTKRDEIDPKKTFWPFVYQIARFLVYNHYRKIAQDKRLLSHLIIITIDHVVDAEQTFIDQETHQLLMQAIEHLPPQRKLVFKLCKFEGKSYQEAGELLGISAATIRNQIVAANKSVKEYFLLNNHMVVILIISAVACLSS